MMQDLIFIGDKMPSLHQDVKDLIVKLLPQTFFEIGVSCLAGDVTVVDPGIKTVMLPLIPVPQHCREGFHVGVFFEVPEEIQQKKADRIIGKTDKAILMGHDGTDEREIY